MRERSAFPVHMYFRITWQLQVLIVATLAVMSGVVRPYIGIPFFLIAFFLVTPLGGVIGRDDRNRRRLSIGICIALALLIVHQVTRISRFEDLVQVLIELACGFLPLMLLRPDRPRSYWLAVLNVAVIAIGSISFTSSPLVYLAFLAFIGVQLLNLNAANLHLPDAAGDTSREVLTSTYFRQFRYVAPAGLLSAVVIFLAFPRVQSFTMSLGNLVTGGRTGYSGMVELSGQGAIEQSAALAFMVESSDRVWLRQAAADVLFRGDSLDTFDGVRWQSTVFDYRQKDRAHDLRVASRHGGTPSDLTVHMEPTTTNAVFYPDVLLDISSHGQGTSAMHFLFNSNGSVIRETFSMDRFQYSLRTAPALAPDALPAEPIAELVRRLAPSDTTQPAPYALSQKMLDLYRVVPPQIGDAEWFKAWVQEVGIDPETTSVARAQARIKQYFLRSFTATLDNKFSGENAFESFVTKDRRGHCEYFATATTLLLRALGLPARVVVGYRGGTFNDLIDVLEVRQENAHAWVETWIPGVGWEVLDPTPPGAADPAHSLGEMARIYANAVSFWFREYVVDYDQTAQRDLLRSLRGISQNGQGDLLSWRELAKSYGRTAGIVIAIGLVVIAMMRIGRRPLKPDALPAYYRRFMRRMERRGLGRDVGETLTAYHRRLAAAEVDAEILQAVDRAIERDLYSPEPLSAVERDELAVRVRDALGRPARRVRA
jgi:hypothetical protein